MDKKLYIKYIYINIAMALATVVLVIFYKDVPQITMEGLLLRCFGGMEFYYDQLDIFQMVILTIPVLFHLTFYMKIISCDLEKSAVYIFTRHNMRTAWFIKKTVFMISLSLMFYLFQFLGATLWGVIFGIEIGCLSAFMRIVLMLLLTTGLFHTAAAYVGNVLTIYFKANFVYLGIVACNIFQFFAISFIKAETVIKLLPVSQSILALHPLKGIGMKTGELMAVRGFSLQSSVIYSAAIIAVFSLWGCFIITKKDLY